MESKQLKKELCTMMNKVWRVTGIKDRHEPCDCICDKQGHEDDYIRVDDGIIEFIKEAVDDKISDLESEAQATLNRIERALEFYKEEEKNM
jgi:hypothetical protein